MRFDQAWLKFQAQTVLTNSENFFFQVDTKTTIKPLVAGLHRDVQNLIAEVSLSCVQWNDINHKLVSHVTKYSGISSFST